MSPDEGHQTFETRANKLAELAQQCAQCQRCKLHSGRTLSVFADGNPYARLMVIGEGPGHYEDQSGIPFVGKAGQLLTRMLASVGFDRSQDTYIANVVKCRPPGNRTPEREEIAACATYLNAQIEAVKPLILILSGATAVRGVLGNESPISRIRGQWIQWQGIWCMPMFHPSYLLRNDSREKGSPKWLAWQDLKAIRKKYQELTADSENDQITS
jgi:uracil-DNA glycosylase family 4